MTLVEFVPLLILVSSLAVVAFLIKRASSDHLSAKIKMERDRLRALKGDYSKSDGND